MSGSRTEKQKHRLYVCHCTAGHESRFFLSRGGNHAKPVLCRLLGFDGCSHFLDRSFCPGKIQKPGPFRCRFRITIVLVSARHSLQIHFPHRDQDNSILQGLAGRASQVSSSGLSLHLKNRPQHSWRKILSPLEAAALGSTLRRNPRTVPSAAPWENAQVSNAR